LDSQSWLSRTQKGVYGLVSDSPLLEIARVLVRFNHVAGGIVNADHCIMRAAANYAGRLSASSAAIRSVIRRPFSEEGTRSLPVGSQPESVLLRKFGNLPLPIMGNTSGDDQSCLTRIEAVGVSLDRGTH